MTGPITSSPGGAGIKPTRRERLAFALVRRRWIAGVTGGLIGGGSPYLGRLWVPAEPLLGIAGVVSICAVIGFGLMVALRRSVIGDGPPSSPMRRLDLISYTAVNRAIDRGEPEALPADLHAMAAREVHRQREVNGWLAVVMGVLALSAAVLTAVMAHHGQPSSALACASFGVLFGALAAWSGWLSRRLAGAEVVLAACRTDAPSGELLSKPAPHGEPRSQESS